jgi:PAS domain S-box-containing protein
MGDWTHDLASGRISWGDTAYQLFGVAPGGFDGTLEGFLKLVHPDDRPGLAEKLADAVARRAEYETEFRVRTPQGEDRWVLGRGQVFWDADGRPAKVVGVGLDVTDRRRVEEALREADRRKDEFLAVLGHELRNPLVPICNAAALIRAAADGDARLGELAAVVQRQAAAMTRLVDELLDVGRIRRGLVEVRSEAVELGELARRAAESARPALEARGQSLRLELPRRPVHFAGDPVRLGQVLHNLLANAARYSEPGRAVTLSASAPDGQVVLAVRDEGIGLRPEALARIWEPFTQADRVPGRAAEGLGLGLSVVRRLVELHGGTVSAHSDGPGNGSTFEVRIPRRDVPAAEEPVFRTGPGRSLRILVCDDNTDGAATTAEVLRLAGHTVRVTHDGRSALEAAGEFRPEAVILDIGLPDLDGREVARRMRVLLAPAHPLLIALTGYGTDADRRSVLDAGFDRHCPKPVDPESLLSLLGEWSAAGR